MRGAGRSRAVARVRALRLLAAPLLSVLLFLAAGGLPGSGATGAAARAGSAASTAAPHAAALGSQRAGGRASAAAVRRGSHAAPAPAVAAAGQADRTAGASPPLLWAAAVVLPGGPPLLTGQLPRPPNDPDARDDVATARGRAPPGTAGT